MNLSLAAFLLVAALPALAQDQGSNWTRHQVVPGVSLEVPRSWELAIDKKLLDSSNTLLQAAGDDVPRLVFLALGERPMDPTLLNVNLVSVSVRRDKDIEELGKLGAKDLAEISEAWRKEAAEPSPVANQRLVAWMGTTQQTTKAGAPALATLARYEMARQRVQAESWRFFRKGVLVVVECSYAELQRPTMAPLCHRILRSVMVASSSSGP